MPLLPVSRELQSRVVLTDFAWSGRLKPEPMITGKIAMDEVEEKGFKALIHDKDNHVKILVQVEP